MNTFDTALHYLQLGLAPIPVKYRDKRPLVKWGPYQKELPTEDQVKRWFSCPQKKNIAVVTGHQGLTVVDFDDADVYVQWLTWATNTGGYVGSVAARSYRVRTARGIHLYLRLQYATRTRALVDKNHQRIGIDIKSRKGYVLAPPSIHPSGIVYRAENPTAPVLSVQALSDVLPAHVLIEEQRLDSEIILPTIKPHTSNDLWYVIEHPEHSDSIVTKIKEGLTLEQFFPMRTKPAQSGRYWMTRCPLHDDKNPSMWLDLSIQRCGCFAGCTEEGKSLDVIGLYARLNDLSNRDAIRVLARTV